MGWIMGHDLGDIALSKRIKEIMNRRHDNSEIRALIDNYLSNYDVCRQNRNTLTHFTGFVPRDANKETVDLSSIRFVRLKDIKAKPEFFPSALIDIRRVALEIRGLSLHSWRIYEVLELLAEGKSPELPPIIVAPELLLKPPQNNTLKPGREPKLSRAERRKRARREARKA
jgi:hypothetical protein